MLNSRENSLVAFGGFLVTFGDFGPFGPFYTFLHVETKIKPVKRLTGFTDASVTSLHTYSNPIHLILFPIRLLLGD